MGSKKKVKFRHEWYLFSAILITGSSTFITIHISTGTPQVVATSFSAIAGLYFLQSDNWRNLPDVIHKWIIFFSVTITIGASGIIYYFNHRE